MATKRESAEEFFTRRGRCLAEQSKIGYDAVMAACKYHSAAEFMDAKGFGEYSGEAHRIWDHLVSDAIYCARRQSKVRRVVASGHHVCGRCGGAGGWEGWPGYTCFDCGGRGRVD